MAFVYEVNGQKVEFDKEPTEQDIDEAAKSLGAAPAARPAEAGCLMKARRAPTARCGWCPSSLYARRDSNPQPTG